MTNLKKIFLAASLIAPALLFTETAFAKYIQQGNSGDKVEVEDCTDTTIKMGGTWSVMPFGATCHGITNPNAETGGAVIYSRELLNPTADTFATSAHIQKKSGVGHSKNDSRTTKIMDIGNNDQVDDLEMIKKHKKRPSKKGIRTTRIKFATSPQDVEGGSEQDHQNKMRAHQKETTRQVPGSKYYKKNIAAPRTETEDAISKAGGVSSDYTADPTPDEMLSGHFLGRTFKKKPKRNRTKLIAAPRMETEDAISKASGDASDYTDDPTPDEMLSGHVFGRTFKKKPRNRPKLIAAPRMGTEDAISKASGDASDYTDDPTPDEMLSGHFLGQSYKKKPKGCMNPNANCKSER